jgi:hypothetical protein
LANQVNPTSKLQTHETCLVFATLPEPVLQFVRSGKTPSQF